MLWLFFWKRFAPLRQSRAGHTLSLVRSSMNWGLGTKVPANCPSEKVSTLVSLSNSHPAGMTSIFSFEELRIHQSGDGKCCPKTQTRGKSCRWSLITASPLTAMLGKLFSITTSLHIENKSQLPDSLERGFHEVLYRESTGHSPPGTHSRNYGLSPKDSYPRSWSSVWQCWKLMNSQEMKP